jgi:hypothetical protein
MASLQRWPDCWASCCDNMKVLDIRGIEGLA